MVLFSLIQKHFRLVLIDRDISKKARKKEVKIQTAPTAFGYITGKK